MPTPPTPIKWSNNIISLEQGGTVFTYNIRVICDYEIVLLYLEHGGLYLYSLGVFSGD